MNGFIILKQSCFILWKNILFHRFTSSINSSYTMNNIFRNNSFFLSLHVSSIICLRQRVKINNTVDFWWYKSSNVVAQKFIGNTYIIFIGFDSLQRVSRRFYHVENVDGRFLCISAMNEYKELSLEELRLQDYTDSDLITSDSIYNLF